MCLLQRLLLAFLFTLMLIGIGHTKEKQRNWQTGTVLDTGRDKSYAGTVGGASGGATTAGNTTYGSASGHSMAVYRVCETYVIDAGDHIYECQEHIKWRWSKPAMLTVNGPVKFAIENDRIYIVSEDGTEHETKIVKKTLKVPPKVNDVPANK
jgi:hypothetical protein